MNKKNFNEVLKQREHEEGAGSEKMTLDSTERVKVLSPGQLVFKRFINNKLAIVGTAVLVFMFFFSFIMPVFYGYSQTQIFYKYDNTVVDYAIASERTDYTMLMTDEDAELHYTVKNNMTASINQMKSSGVTESILTDPDGNIYTLKEDEENIYSLYQANRVEVCSISSEMNYAQYSEITGEVSYEDGAEELEGFEDALKTALNAGKSNFSVEGIDFTVTAGKLRTYTVTRAGGGISYTGSALGADFEAQVEENIAGGTFTWQDKTYSVTTEDGITHVYELSGESLLAYLTTYVFDAYDDDFNISDEFRTQAVAASVGDGSFSADGVEYKIVAEDEEVLIYNAGNSENPVAVFSNFAIRAYNGEDIMGFAFKERAREVIEEMEETGSKTESFTWEIAQVNADGEYTFDEEGNTVKEEREVVITIKNGSYMMTTEQVVYLIDTFASPSKAHWFGTDGDGMDVLARMMYGGRVSLIVSFIVIIIETILGVILGGIAGFFGGWVDNLIMRLVDIFYCIPSMPILIILGALFDALKMKPYVRVMWLMVVLGVLGWAGVARLVRGQILSLREQEFMVAAEATGLNTKRRIFKHLVPNVMPQLIVSATSGLGSIIITESTLSYLGLGVKHPLATWGTMINSVSTAEAMKNYTYIWVPVGLLICLTVIAFNFVGDGLRDAFDPKMKR